MDETTNVETEIPTETPEPTTPVLAYVAVGAAATAAGFALVRFAKAWKAGRKSQEDDVHVVTDLPETD